MLSSVKWSILALVGLYLTILLLMYLFQRHLLYFPRTAEQYAMPHNYQLDRDDITLRGWSLNPGSPRAMIYFGGNAERIDHNIDWLPKLFPDHAIYLVNYRGYGGSDGRPTEQAISEDAVAVFDDLTEDFEVGEVERMSQPQLDPLVRAGPGGELLEIAVIPHDAVRDGDHPFAQGGDVGEIVRGEDDGRLMPRHVLSDEPADFDLRLEVAVDALHAERAALERLELLPARDQLYGIARLRQAASEIGAQGAGAVDRDPRLCRRVVVGYGRIVGPPGAALPWKG